MRGDQSGLRQGTGGVLEPSTAWTEGQVPAAQHGYKPGIQDMTCEVVASWWTVEFIPLRHALTCLSHGSSCIANTWSIDLPHPPPSAHVDVLVSMVAGGCVKVSLPAVMSFIGSRQRKRLVLQLLVKDVYRLTLGPEV